MEASTEEGPRARQEAERGHLEHVQGAAAVRQLPAEVQAHVVAGAHEESLAAAEGASKTLRSGGVPHDTPGSGAAVEVHLPSAEAWEAALRPRAIEPAPPEAGATTGVDPLTYYAPTRWPGADDAGAGA